jgi:beta-glucosidase
MNGVVFGMSAVFASLLAIAAGNLAFAQQAGGALMPSAVPWMNAALAPDQRADLLAAQLNQDEELTLVKGYFGASLKLTFIKPSPAALQPVLPGTAGYVPGIPRLGIPPLIESDAGVGIANSMHMRPGDTATALPSTLLSASTWNPALAFLAGRSIGTEARDRGYNVVLDGALNLAREPRGGRTFEYAGEDPLLAGTIAGETIRGIESARVISTMKHFALNDQETGRGALSANLPEAAMRESDLLALEIALEHGNPGAVMCSYNRVNGTYACENDFLLNHVLKQDWNFPGWVLSDWGGVHSTGPAANAGLDQESASNFDAQEFYGAPLARALADGTVPRERLHDMVHRILRSMFANGIFDDPPQKAPPPLAEDRAQAQREAEEGIVLLKNANGILPLAKRARSIAVIGAHADVGMLSGGGSSQVVPLDDDPEKEFPVGGPVIILPNGAPIMPTGRHIYDPPSPLAALASAAPHARVRYDPGDNIEAATKLAGRSQIAIVFVQQWMTEGQDVKNLSLPGAQDALVEAVVAANPRTIVVLETGGPVLMPWLGKVPAVLEAWYAGNGGAPALARILFGDISASGHLPITFPQSEDQLPHPVPPGSTWRKGPFDVDYTEGANVGYRWFEQQKTTPLFPFGFGLSYTSFRISGLQAAVGDTLGVSADVTNLGAREGSETVQLYATPPAPGSVSRLIGWSKVSLKPGETRHVAIAVDPRLLARFDSEGQSWLIEAGAYTLSAGASASDASATIAVTLTERRIKP